MGLILNFGGWKKLYEQQTTKPVNYAQLTQEDIEFGRLQKGKSVLYPGLVLIGKSGAVLSAAPENFKVGTGVILLKDPVIYTDSKGIGGIAIGRQYFVKDGGQPTPNTEMIALVSFNFTPSDTQYGRTEPTKVRQMRFPISASGFIAELLHYLDYVSDLSPIDAYYINIIKGFTQRAEEIPGLAQSIIEYNADFQSDDKRNWKSKLAAALISKKIVKDQAAAEKWVTTHASTLGKIFS